VLSKTRPRVLCVDDDEDSRVYAAYKKKGIDAGADAYATKPDISELLRSINCSTRISEFTQRLIFQHGIKKKRGATSEGTYRILL